MFVLGWVIYYYGDFWEGGGTKTVIDLLTT